MRDKSINYSSNRWGGGKSKECTKQRTMGDSFKKLVILLFKQSKFVLSPGLPFLHDFDKIGARAALNIFMFG